MAMTQRNPDLAKLLPDLQALGFTEYEARAYVALVQLQTATAYEVSKLSGLPKANCYSVLEGLSDKQAAQPVSQNPVRYVAIAPSVLFENISTSTTRRCTRLAERMSKLSKGDDEDYVWSIRDVDAIRSRIDAMIDSATSHVWVKAAESTLDPHRQALRRAAQRGVKVLVILFGTHPERFQFRNGSRVYLHEGNGVPVGIAPTLITVTVDFREALVADFGTQACGSYTRNRPIVTLADTLIRHEIYIAEIFDVFSRSIQDRFGPALIQLRRKYLPQRQVTELEKLLKSTSSQTKHVEAAG